MGSLKTMVPKHSAGLKFVGLQQFAVVQLIRELRPLIQLTQKQCATLPGVTTGVTTGVTYSALNHWENAHMQPLTLALKQIQFVMHQAKNDPIPLLRDKDKLLFDNYLTSIF